MGARAYYILSIRICKNRFCTVWEIYFIRLMSSAEPFFYSLIFNFFFISRLSGLYLCISTPIRFRQETVLRTESL